MYIYGKGVAQLEGAAPVKSSRGLIRCVSKDRGMAAGRSAVSSSSIKDRDGGGWGKP